MRAVKIVDIDQGMLSRLLGPSPKGVKGYARTHHGVRLSPLNHYRV